MSAPETLLGIDLGGTKVHLRLAGPQGVVLDRRLPTADHPDLETLVLSALGDRMPDATAVGIAGPVQGDRAHVTNVGWNIEAGTLARALGGGKVVLANDMAIVAHGLATLRAEETIVLQEGSREERGPILIVGVGTGMGTGLLVPELGGAADRYLAGEGGHATWAPRTEEDRELQAWLAERHGHVSLERVVSGTGLATAAQWADGSGRPLAEGVREALASGEGVAAAVVAAAESGTCPTSAGILGRFVSTLGAAIGNAALTTLPTGGIFLAGGVAQKLAGHLGQGSLFLESMRDKGRMRGLVAGLHVAVVKAEDVAIRGALALAARA
ncbi:MAG: ROK family protein [Candidatus Sericytochromatia bacterium]|nr:ROK family protein [Candidatus Sericytochromatia bacterium]